MSSRGEWIERLRREIPEIRAEEVFRRLGSPGEDMVIADVREGEEYRSGHIQGAVHLPRGYLELQAEARLRGAKGRVVLYCASGVRSLLAAEALRKLGFPDVASLAGGLARWKELGYPILRAKNQESLESVEALTEAEREQYARHLTLEEVGEAGQVLLKKAKVLCVGAGGLGSAAAMYLAAAGVGRLGIVDDDRVDRSNLQRQVLHTVDRLGWPKTESARRTLTALNPLVEVVTHAERLTSATVDGILPAYDMVLDGSDNFPTRYLLSDACVKHGKPGIHGSVYRFEGQVTVLWPGRGPCYRCLYPEPPPSGSVPSCAETGVLGALPGVVGLLQAIECLKIILGKGDLLLGRLLTFSALEARFREFAIRADPECRYCSRDRPFPGYVDYEGFCGP
jgi:molybdopterin/thiamine biosynthesis adenylyltransferase/rhodanese-related sulfurtransferase